MILTQDIDIKYVLIGTKSLECLDVLEKGPPWSLFIFCSINNDYVPITFQPWCLEGELHDE